MSLEHLVRMTCDHVDDGKSPCGGVSAMGTESEMAELGWVHWQVPLSEDVGLDPWCWTTCPGCVDDRLRRASAALTRARKMEGAGKAFRVTDFGHHEDSDTPYVYVTVESPGASLEVIGPFSYPGSYPMTKACMEAFRESLASAMLAVTEES